MRGSSDWARSHHTVAFCFRIKATYDVGDTEVVDREEVLRRGPLELLVGARCRPVFVALEDVEEVAFDSVLRVCCCCPYCVCWGGAMLGAKLYTEFVRLSMLFPVVVAIVL